ncbi:hypothetical protein K7G19_19880 [Cupriavidus sp. DB3]|uniref:hypothetical protein n=1 Tax=Cupriavidus sp. DB3 TaxID=2873259 RepID=UPI001CF44E47|nr:hypothetical protein [Cupriavidus sp. DB3]MCA7085853.1 hypothetical protein [Cupriavidus sp. DB3]
MGILDAFKGLSENGQLTPGGQGLLAAGLGILAANRGMTAGMPALGIGGLQGLQAYGGAKQQQALDGYRQTQADKLKLEMDNAARELERKDALQSFLISAFKPRPATTAGPSGSPSGGGQVPAMGATGMGGAAGPGNAGVGSEFPLSLNDATLLKALGGPDLIEAVKFANTPQGFAAGGYVRDPVSGRMTYNPQVDKGMGINQSGQVYNLPGYVQAAADQSGATTAAQEAAKAGYDLVQVPMPDGSTVMMPRAQAAQVLRGGRAQGGAAPGGAFGVGQSPATGTYENEMAKQAAEQYKAVQEAGASASKRIAALRQIDTLLGDYDGGKLTPLGTNIASTLNSLGIKVDEKLPNKEAAAAVSNQIALQLRDPSSGAGMPGALSDSDRQFLASMVPNAAQSADGRRLLIDAGIRMAERQQQVAEMARKWRQRYGRLDAANPNTGRTFEDNLQIWSSQNPLFPTQK